MSALHNINLLSYPKINSFSNGFDLDFRPGFPKIFKIHYAGDGGIGSPVSEAGVYSSRLQRTCIST